MSIADLSDGILGNLLMTLIDLFVRTAINIKNSTLECFQVLSFI